MTNEIPPRPIRLAIVGLGKIARDQHLPAIAADPQFELVATASPHGRVDGVPGYSSIEELLSAGHELDAVSICTPPVGRSLIAAPALDAGLAVMLEKPPAATLSEVEEMERRAKATGSVLFASWHSREAAGVAAAREWLAMRRVERVNIEWREDIRRWHPGQDWILGPGGFGVFDPGINALSIVTALLADPIAIKSAELTIPEGRASPISATLRMRCGSAPVTADFDFLHEGHQQWDIVVEADGGRLVLKEGGRLLEINGSVTEGPDREYPRLYARFANLIQARKCDVDAVPMQLVADAFQLGVRRIGPGFNW
jgi:D-galactose 1-dehydrogenase/L-arabinose 1- dehydrogenase